MRLATLIPILALLSAGCATPFSELEDSSFAITAGSVQAIGVLALLNDPGTDIDTLDFDAALNVRSARNLMQHRDGYDGVFGTYDDDIFNDIEEVDSVRWVGPSALAQLVSYAATVGWIPQGDDFLGTWDHVTFTVNEAQHTLDYTNDADLSTLDIDLRLDSRAAGSIVAAQPIATVEELAGLYYVGTSALTKLKDYAEGEGENPGCLSDSEAEAVVAEILEAHGITELEVILPPDEVCAQQQEYDNLVSFSEAVEAAVVSFLSDDEDIDSPLARLEFVDGGPCLAGDPSDRVRCFMDRDDSSLELIGPLSRFPPEHGESLAESWSFYLSMDALSDHLFWAIVDRSGAQPAYNYGFN